MMAEQQIPRSDRINRRVVLTLYGNVITALIVITVVIIIIAISWSPPVSWSPCVIVVILVVLEILQERADVSDIGTG